MQLKRGEAEVFGTALVLGDTLTLTGQKIAVFTWEGCKLAITGQPDILLSDVAGVSAGQVLLWSVDRFGDLPMSIWLIKIPV